MKRISLILLAFSCSTIAFAQDAPSTKPLLPADFTLHDASRKEEKPRTVLGPMTTDKQGKATGSGSFAVYGGSSMIQVSSLSFSADGKLLAVGSTPSIIDVWDVEKRQKFAPSTTERLSLFLQTDAALPRMDAMSEFGMSNPASY